MSDNHNYCVIMAGGWGSRFWPVSRSYKPKQFLDFYNSGASFLRKTYDRMKRIIPEENILVVSLEKYRNIVQEQIPKLEERNLLLEPYNRNTAPCIAYSTYTLLKRDPLAVVITTPSDHLIDNVEMFDESVRQALRFASSNDSLITLGIVPTSPDSNFGYIQVSGKSEDGRPVPVKTFTEKPDPELAEVFIDSGEFLWNSGIFIWRASAIRDELEKYLPEMTSFWKGWENFIDTPLCTSEIRRIYGGVARLSIDHGVMEKTDMAWVIPAQFKWRDVGSWESLYDSFPEKDGRGNVIIDEGKTFVKNISDSFVYSSSKDKLIVVKDIKDFLIYDSDDVLMICPRNETAIRKLASDLAMPEFEKYK